MHFQTTEKSVLKRSLKCVVMETETEVFVETESVDENGCFFFVGKDIRKTTIVLFQVTGNSGVSRYRLNKWL